MTLLLGLYDDKKKLDGISVSTMDFQKVLKKQLEHALFPLK